MIYYSSQSARTLENSSWIPQHSHQFKITGTSTIHTFAYKRGTDFNCFQPENILLCILVSFSDMEGQRIIHCTCICSSPKQETHFILYIDTASPNSGVGVTCRISQGAVLQQCESTQICQTCPSITPACMQLMSDTTEKSLFLARLLFRQICFLNQLATWLQKHTGEGGTASAQSQGAV